MPHHFSHAPRIGILAPYTDPPCGLARFSVGLSGALNAQRGDAKIIWAADGHLSPYSRAIVERVNDPVSSGPACTDLFDDVDVAVIQHEHGVYADGVVDLVEGLRVPSIVIIHAIPRKPTSQDRSVLAAIAAVADHVVVMSEAARQRLCLDYAVDRRKITAIAHGATVPTAPRVKRPSRPTILTWGLLRPGKGIERVIDVMPSLSDVPGRPRFVIAGPTHPKALAADGEAYRDACIEQARRVGVADSVSFDPRYYDGAVLAALIQQSSVVVLPYDSTEQVSSGVLADAVANGRPVVATAFPHAVELLDNGAGIVVDHKDPGALASALRQILTQPRLAGDMAAEARGRAPELAWPVVASAYLRLAQHLLAERRARV
ncbi:glycosyltransferase [Mycobacterium sp. NPDC048908]|uniref:glycosyltransferase n=1 Tax=Mycobacterium sp. NPDC048908 TaxID=3364292 RepID=UPI003718EE33